MQREETLSHLVSSGCLRTRGIIRAMRRVRREDFIPPALAARAWEDRPLPIGLGQTISAPHMYAIMLEAAQVRKGECVLEVGTGSGYGAALLSLLAGKKGKVYSLEVLPELALSAKENLSRARLKAEVIVADGHSGYPRAAPYDKILVTAACAQIPPALLPQLKEGGRLLAPVGGPCQELLLVEKKKSKLRATALLPVVFVPLVKKG